MLPPSHESGDIDAYKATEEQPKSESLKKYWHKVLAPGGKKGRVASYVPPQDSYVPPQETEAKVGSKEYWQELRRRDPIWRRGRILCAAVFFIMLGIGAALWNYRAVGETIAKNYEPPLAVALPGKLSCRSAELQRDDLVPIDSTVSSRECDTGVLQLRNGGNIRLDSKTAAKIIYLEEHDDVMQAAVHLEYGRVCISCLPASFARCDSQIVMVEPDSAEETVYALSSLSDGAGKPYTLTQVVKGQVTVSNIRGKLVKINLKAGDSLKSYQGNLGQALPFYPDAWLFWNSTWNDTSAVAWPAYKPAAAAAKADGKASDKKSAADAKKKETEPVKKAKTKT